MNDDLKNEYILYILDVVGKSKKQKHFYILSVRRHRFTVWAFSVTKVDGVCFDVYDIF